MPPAFCKQLTGQTLQKAVLKSSLGLWHVKVGSCCKGRLYFEEEWEDFVKHHGLILGDFVFFQHKGGMVFDVLVLDSSTCEKDFPPATIGLAERKKRSSREAKSHHHPRNLKGQSPPEDAKSYSAEGPHFITTMKRSNGCSKKPYMNIVHGGLEADAPPFWVFLRLLDEWQRLGLGTTCFKLNIPSEFAKANLVQRSRVILRDPSKKLWPMKLKGRVIKGGAKVYARTFIGKGWYEFYVANKLKPGDACLFELDLTRKVSAVMLMDVHIFRNDGL
ncbi:unnamed protein product [Dovyalis caffra]|uniref:TF-B3 domain-containing protein n=1 Tax=Dovyalis caffra TaxID=77055 RepID=A0AAV1S9K3_9ROSI|nr:unnamed protein product [Dovyalis caffra]